MWIQYIKGMAQRPRKTKQCTSFEDKAKGLSEVKKKKKLTGYKVPRNWK